MADLPTGILTFLFTDIEGSTRLWEEHPQAMDAALARHNALAAALIEQHHGTLLKSHGEGDSLFAVFARAQDAVTAACALQRALLIADFGMRNADWGTPGTESLAAEPEPGSEPDSSPWTTAAGSEGEHSQSAIRIPHSAIETLQLKVRMALHTGEAVLREGDYYGAAVNRCARLRAAAHGGQALLSGATEEALQGRLPEGIRLKDLGSHRLRDLARPERVYQLLHPELPADFPPLRSLDTHPNNLPQQLTSFIGRQKEMAEVEALLGGTRLLTLAGAGGTGKTRLGLQVAAHLLDQYEDGVWLVELAPLSDPALVPQAVAAPFGVKEEPGKPLVRTVTEYLKRKHLLLVLDNCEHLLMACAALAEAILQGCPHVRVLATSREGLNIAGEHTYRVPSLSLPDPRNLPSLEHLAEYEAVKLFVERAALSRPGFRVTQQNAPAVAQVCCRLDGIPLAIELAAARSKALPVEKLNERLDDRFRLLTGGSRTALPRQQTLRALIDWSYDLLSEPERALLRRLSVFAGGWTLEAAEAIADCGLRIADWGSPGIEILAASKPERGTDLESSPSETDAGSGGGSSQSAFRIPHSAILDLLTGLVEKSLVVYEEGSERYRLLETVRQYARDRLLEAGDGEAIRARHREYFLALAEEAEGHLTGPQQREWLERLETEHENLRAALDWSVSERMKDEGGRMNPIPFILHPSSFILRMAGALWRFWRVRGHLTEGRERLAQALARPGGTAAGRAKALNGAGILACVQSDFRTARSLLEEALAIFRQIGDRRGIAGTLIHLGNVALAHPDRQAAARSLYEESLAIHRELGDRPGTACCLANLGEVARNQGDDAAARTLFEEGLVTFRELGDERSIALLLSNLGNISQEHGDYGAARSLYEESLAISRELGDRWGIAASLGNLGSAAYDQGDYAAARSLHEQKLAISRDLGDSGAIAASFDNLAKVASKQGDDQAARSLHEQSLAVRREFGLP
jgi:predicted ATPase/class 3 adenylate cyclase